MDETGLLMSAKHTGARPDQKDQIDAQSRMRTVSLSLREDFSGAFELGASCGRLAGRLIGLVSGLMTRPHIGRPHKTILHGDPAKTCRAPACQKAFSRPSVTLRARIRRS